MLGSAGAMDAYLMHPQHQQPHGAGMGSASWAQQQQQHLGMSVMMDGLQQLRTSPFGLLQVREH